MWTKRIYDEKASEKYLGQVATHVQGKTKVKGDQLADQTRKP
jgi:hypothetical protein